MLENLPALWKKLSAEALICGNWKAHNNLCWIKVPAQLNTSTDSPRWATIGHVFTGITPEHAALDLPPLTEDQAPLGIQKLTTQYQQLRTALDLPGISSSGWAPPPLSKPTQHSSLVNLPVTCAEKKKKKPQNSFQSFSWHVGCWPCSHQLPTQLLKVCCFRAGIPQPSPQVDRKGALLHKSPYAHWELWLSGKRQTPLPKQTPPAAAPAHHRPTASLRRGNIRLTLQEVRDVMTKLEGKSMKAYLKSHCL